MDLFLDECLSRTLADRINAGGQHTALHPIQVGRRGEPDDVVLQRCVAEDRVVVTENARDFRKLVAGADIHPGLIVLPCVGRERSYELLMVVLAFLTRRGEPADLMVNHVVEVDAQGTIAFYALPADE